MRKIMLFLLLLLHDEPVFMFQKYIACKGKEIDFLIIPPVT